MNNNPPLGEQLLDFIITNKLFTIAPVEPDRYLIIWSSGAAEQLDAWLAEYTKELESNPPTTPKMLKPPTIYKRRLLIDFTAQLIFSGEIFLDDCSTKEQAQEKLPEALNAFFNLVPFDYKINNFEILSVSNEDLTSNDYPR